MKGPRSVNKDFSQFPAKLYTSGINGTENKETLLSRAFGAVEAAQEKITETGLKRSMETEMDCYIT